MKLWNFIGFEVSYQSRRISIWIYFTLLFTAGPIAITLLNDPGGGTHANAPIYMAVASVIIGFLGLLITADLFSNVGNRDTRHGMAPLFYTTPVKKIEYLGGRFLGTFLVNALLLLAIPLGLMLGPEILSISLDNLSPYNVGSYLLPYLFFLLPNLLINASILFGLSILSRRAIPGYLGAIGLFMGYALAIASTRGLEPTYGALLDPSGFVALGEITSDFTSVEQNTRLIEMNGILLWNRLLWMIVGIAMFTYTCFRFRFSHSVQGSKRDDKLEKNTFQDLEKRSEWIRKAPLEIPTLNFSFNFWSSLEQTAAIMKQGLKRIFGGRDFYVVVVGLTLFILAFGFDMMDDPRYGTSLLPLTSAVISKVMSSFYINVIIIGIVAFYAGELLWSERDDNLDSIMDATPVSEVVLFAGKFLALTVMLVTLQMVLFGSGIILQAIKGYYNFQPTLYVEILFGLQLVDYLLFAMAAMFVHVLVNQKYAGHFTFALFYLYTVYANKIGIDHNLLIYGSDPGWIYSDMNGFGAFIKPWMWFKTYWAGWALLFAILSCLLWVRGSKNNIRDRLIIAHRRMTTSVALFTSGVVLLIICAGGYIFYNTNVLNKYSNDSEWEDVLAEYEKRYKQYEHLPQPWLTDIKLHVEIYPDQRMVSVHGTYNLINKTDQPIDSVHISFVPNPNIKMQSLSLGRPASPVVEDTLHAYRIYPLNRSLQPGDSLKMFYTIELEKRGFENNELNTFNRAVAGNGTYLSSSNILPLIGYQTDWELTETEKRQDHGLGPRNIRRPIDDFYGQAMPAISTHADWVNFSATVGTANDQIVVAPGTLRKKWTDKDRHYFHFQTETPVLLAFGLFSAEYAINETKWKDIKIRSFHSPNHVFNLEHKVDIVKKSLEYFSKEFGQYPRKEFKLVEVPRYHSVAGRAYPGMLVYPENSSISLSQREENANSIDATLYITAHEVSHQWWFHHVMGADVEGSQVLSETLAGYSAMMLLEKELGVEPIRQYMQSLQIMYLNGRNSHNTPEVPLLYTSDHDYIHYRKGAAVMYALRNYVGEEQVNTALRRFASKYGMQGSPYPTSLDLYQELKIVTSDSLQYLLNDFFKEITFWDLQTLEASAVATDSDSYEVTLEIEATKLRADSIGNDTPIPMNDLVEIGIFAAENKEGLTEPLYLRKHRIKSGQQTITVTVPGKPGRVGIDPYHLLIARHKSNLINGKIREVYIIQDE